MRWPMLISTTVVAVLAPLIIYAFMLVYLFKKCSRDPTSVFFDPRTAYEPQYTRVRRKEAIDFIEKLGHLSFKRLSTTTGIDRPPFLCIGMPSVNRSEGEQYIQYSVGSLFHGLNPEERQEIYFLPFIAHTEPNFHPAYQEQWLNHVADALLEYDRSAPEFDRIKSLERDRDFAKKGLFDYSWLLEKCAETGAAYVAMIEDDVIALDGWFHRTKKALTAAEADPRILNPSFLYLRLFYTEEYLGWNSDEWRSYVFWSLLTLGAFELLGFSIVLGVLRRNISKRRLFAACAIHCAACIGLFFMAGKGTVLPPSRGVTQINKYGCCGQGLIFPRDRVPSLVDWYRSQGVGFIDSLTEELADRTGLTRWALVPSVLQHIGGKSSKGDKYGGLFIKHDRSITERIWNFGFETNNAKSLHTEHARATVSP